MKRLAILHYHLRPGGITTVIRSASRALSDDFDIRVVADFGYNDQPARSREAFLADARALMRRLVSRLRGVDILHTHNLTLGKHPRLTCAVKMLAEQGRITILNQIHDFAEDERPPQLRALRYCTGRRDDRFWRTICYYDLPNVRWVTLTTHAAKILAQRGVPKQKVHVLPNPVDAELIATLGSAGRRRRALTAVAAYARAHGYDFDPRRKLLFNPMKIMLRKNNAEAIELVRRLNALRGRDEYQLLVGPVVSAPADVAYAERLERLVRHERLPVVLGYSAPLSEVVPLLHAAHAIVTTSKQEGFGYAFVEGWLCGKMVVGRDIPEVTRDFKSAGMDLRHLHREFDARALRRIERLISEPPRALVQTNRAVVEKHFSLAAYAKRFKQILWRSQLTFGVQASAWPERATQTS